MKYWWIVLYSVILALDLSVMAMGQERQGDCPNGQIETGRISIATMPPQDGGPTCTPWPPLGNPQRDAPKQMKLRNYSYEPHLHEQECPAGLICKAPQRPIPDICGYLSSHWACKWPFNRMAVPGPEERKQETDEEEVERQWHGASFLMPDGRIWTRDREDLVYAGELATSSYCLYSELKDGHYQHMYCLTAYKWNGEKWEPVAGIAQGKIEP